MNGDEAGASVLPLANVKVLDVADLLAGPVAATFLADFGAEVVKAQLPQAQSIRHVYGLHENRNKKSITLDLRTESGRRLLERLLPLFDVAVFSYRPPTLEGWGLDPPSLHGRRPRLVALYVSGYGQTGPYRTHGAFDRVASAFAGATHVSGEPDRPPVRAGYPLIDYMTAYLGAFAVMVALYHRDLHGGAGQVIDLALYEAAFRASATSLTDFSLLGTIPQRHGNLDPRAVPASNFLASDGRWITLHAGADPLFRRLAAVMQRPDLLDDERFATMDARLANQEALYAIIAQWAAAKSSDELVEILNAVEVPVSKLLDIAEIARDPHYLARGTIRQVVDEQYGELLMVAPLPALSETPGSIRSLGPAPGAHNAEVYGGWLGLSDDEIAEHARDGAI